MQRGFANVSTGLDALDIADSAHAALLGRDLFTSVTYNRLSKAEALEIIDGWPESPAREETRRNIETR